MWKADYGIHLFRTKTSTTADYFVARGTYMTSLDCNGTKHGWAALSCITFVRRVIGPDNNHVGGAPQGGTVLKRHHRTAGRLDRGQGAKVVTRILPTGLVLANHARRADDRGVPLIDSDDQTVPITVQGRSRLTPAEAFERIVPVDLPSVFHAIWPFPGVARVENQTEPWDHVGPSRTPVFDDGSRATETLTEYVDGRSFAYELTQFTNVLGRLVYGVRGEWTFTPDGNGTLIRWCYEFKPRHGRAWILAGPFKPLWSRYMRSALKAILAQVAG
ncbi:SRPBCC family protein [Kribbella deserti]|uniref:SRPBCC family protein n=1 Tax=Kribbella deserti TaxID=1926257 RepID=A0ABV6QNI7_9ACTN